MKRTLTLLFLLTSLSIKAQTSDSTNQVTETFKDTVLMSAPKKTFGEKLGKFLGIDKTDEIEMLKKKVEKQSTVIDSLSVAAAIPKIVIKTIPSLNEAQTKSIRKDEKFVNNLPKSYKNIPKNDLEKITSEIDKKIIELVKQRDALLSSGGNKDLINAKSNIILSLEREKNVIKLSKETSSLKDENLTLVDKNDMLVDKNDILKTEGDKLKKYLYVSFAILFVLILIIAVVLQRKKIIVQDDEIEKQLEDITKKNSYIEHAARIIRHDMHSGINTYMPRGLSSLEKKLKPADIEKLKIESALKMIKEGLTHTQRVYKGVYEFTNLVKQDVVLKKANMDVKEALLKNLANTSYMSQVTIEDLGELEINEVLFCTAIDSLIKNGLKYNDSENKLVKIYLSEGCLIVEDNGRGMTQKEFDKYSKPKSFENGLGISIAVAILKEHSFSVSCDKNNGTKIKIKVK